MCEGKGVRLGSKGALLNSCSLAPQWGMTAQCVTYTIERYHQVEIVLFASAQADIRLLHVGDTWTDRGDSSGRGIMHGDVHTVQCYHSSYAYKILRHMHVRTPMAMA